MCVQAMSPPDFIRYLEGGGVNPHHCMVCAHGASYSLQMTCMKYGASVLVYSSCGSFERAERGQPVVQKEDVRAKFEWGPVDLRGGKK
jgi:hypothetical protein